MCKFICRLFKKKKPTTNPQPQPPTPPINNYGNGFSVLNNSATPIDVSISFDGSIIATQTCAGNSVTKITPNPQYTPNAAAFIELYCSNGYTPSSADLTFNLTNHAPDSYGNPITWNKIDITGVTTDFEFILNP